MDGYSESMNATQCIKCSRIIYFGYSIYPIITALLLICIVILTSSDYICDQNSSRKERRTRTKKKKEFIALANVLYKLIIKLHYYHLKNL